MCQPVVPCTERILLTARKLFGFRLQGDSAKDVRTKRTSAALREKSLAFGKIPAELAEQDHPLRTLRHTLFICTANSLQ